MLDFTRPFKMLRTRVTLKRKILESNMYTYTFQNYSACDAIKILKLITIIPMRGRKPSLNIVAKFFLVVIIIVPTIIQPFQKRRKFLVQFNRNTSLTCA